MSLCIYAFLNLQHSYIRYRKLSDTGEGELVSTMKSLAEELISLLFKPKNFLKTSLYSRNNPALDSSYLRVGRLLPDLILIILYI